MARLTPPKPGQIDVSDRSKLVKLEVNKLVVKKMDIPRPPGVNIEAKIPVMAECEGKQDNLIAFDLSKDYDMDKFTDRFKR